MAARASQPEHAAAIEWPHPAALAALAALALLLMLAPPAHNAFWGVNGLRSVPPYSAALVGFAALAAAALVWRAPRFEHAPVVAAAIGATLLAFPLREAVHHLGDTATRHGAVVNFLRAAYTQPLSEWAKQLHAQPLDLAFGLLLTSRVAASTGSVDLAVSIVSWLLATIGLVCAWHVAAKLDAGRGSVWGLWIALVAWGGLQAWAGYAEAAGLVLTTALAWWLAMLSPLVRRRHGAYLAATWLLAAFSHRAALLLLAPSLLRLLGPPLAGDTPAGRRAGLALLGVAAAVAAVAASLAGPGQLVTDARELLRGPDPSAWASVPGDLANLVLLVAPLALVGPVLAGRDARRAFARDPRAGWAVLAAVVSAPLAFPLPVAGNGLGLHRDWDLSLMPALSLTLAGALMLSHLPATRLRGALLALAPVLVLGAGGWLAVNGDAPASLRRVDALAHGAPPLGTPQRAAVLLFGGVRAMDEGNAPGAARMLQESWDLVPAPGRGTQAILAWLVAGEPDSARRMLAAMRARRGLDARTTATLDTLERQIGVVERLTRR